MLFLSFFLPSLFCFVWICVQKVRAKKSDTGLYRNHIDCFVLFFLGAGYRDVRDGPDITRYRTCLVRDKWLHFCASSLPSSWGDDGDVRNRM